MKLTNTAGNTGAAATATAILDQTAPTGYTITPDEQTFNATSAASAGFTFANAEVGDTYSYTISSSAGGTPVAANGTVGSATQDVTGINISSLPDGTLTFSVKLTDPAGNVGAAVTTTATLNQTTPSGYSISSDHATYNATSAASAGFTFANAVVGATYAYTISDSAGGTAITGNGTVSAAKQDVTGINVSSLPDGTLTFSVTLTSAGKTGTAATATATLDQTAPTGYTITANAATYNATTSASAGFTFANAEIGDTYAYTVSSSGGGTPITGHGTVSSATQRRHRHQRLVVVRRCAYLQRQADQRRRQYRRRGHGQRDPRPDRADRLLDQLRPVRLQRHDLGFSRLHFH